jgi:hypothetical protein
MEKFSAYRVSTLTTSTINLNDSHLGSRDGHSAFSYPSSTFGSGPSGQCSPANWLLGWRNPIPAYPRSCFRLHHVKWDIVFICEPSVLIITQYLTVPETSSSIISNSDIYLHISNRAPCPSSGRSLVDTSRDSYKKARVSTINIIGASCTFIQPGHSRRSIKTAETWSPDAGDIIVSNWASWIEILWLAFRYDHPSFVLGALISLCSSDSIRYLFSPYLKPSTYLYLPRIRLLQPPQVAAQEQAQPIYRHLTEP